LKHARALAALCAPCVNSYKRLVVGRSLSGATWAPAFISYGGLELVDTYIVDRGLRVEAIELLAARVKRLIVTED